MQTNCMKNLLNLKDFIVKNIKNLKDKVEIYIELPVKEHICPCCGHSTSNIHDYYTQTIKDIPIYFKPTFLIIRKRRYVCNHCDKKFLNIILYFLNMLEELLGYLVLLLISFVL